MEENNNTSEKSPFEGTVWEITKDFFTTVPSYLSSYDIHFYENDGEMVKVDDSTNVPKISFRYNYNKLLLQIYSKN